MLQRKPTRIELRPDDAKDFELFWKDVSQKRKQSTTNSGDEAVKPSSEIVKERIGYHPKPQNIESQALR